MTHYKQSPKHTPRTPQHTALNKQALFNSKCGVRISPYTNNGSYEQALKNLSKHLPLAVEVFTEPSLMLLACAAHGELDTVLDTPYSLKDVKPQNVPRTPHALLNVLGFVYATVPLTGDLMTDWCEVLRAYTSSSAAAMVYCSRQGVKGVAFGKLPLIVRQLCSHSTPTRQLVQVLTGRQGTKRRNRFLGEQQVRQPPVLYRVASYTYELEHKPFKTAEPFLGRSLLHFIERVEHCHELVTLGGEYGEMPFNKLTYTLTI